MCVWIRTQCQHDGTPHLDAQRTGGKQGMMETTFHSTVDLEGGVDNQALEPAHSLPAWQGEER
jgi:hypothetical protein